VILGGLHIRTLVFKGKWKAMFRDWHPLPTAIGMCSCVPPPESNALTVRPARGASPSRHHPITRGHYAPQSRSPGVPPMIMVLTQEVNVMHVVHPV
jgi:hypothetical protein